MDVNRFIAYKKFMNAYILMEMIINSCGTFLLVTAAHSDYTGKHIRPRLSTAAIQCSHSYMTSAVFVIIFVDFKQYFV
jgi:hypothetical protein